MLQGLAAGVGFLGAGAIIKQSEKGEVLGLTTAAGLYFTTAVGVAAGMGREVTAILGTALAAVVLTALPRVESWLQGRAPDEDAPQRPAPDAERTDRGRA